MAPSLWIPLSCVIREFDHAGIKLTIFLGEFVNSEYEYEYEHKHEHEVDYDLVAELINTTQHTMADTVEEMG